MTLEDLLLQYSIPTAPESHHHSRQGWIQVDCPLCGRGSRKYHLGYNITGRFFNCWQCGSGNPTKIIQELFNLNYSDAEKIFKGLPKSRKIITEVYRGNYKPPPSEPLSPLHRKYLKSRRFEPSEVKKLWEVSGTTTGRLSWRLLIPIIHKGEKVSWTTRTIGNSSTRYISASPEEESVNHKNILYGGDYVRDTVIICEGPTDVWRVGPGAVAIMGLLISSSQLLWLKNIPRRIVCLDNSMPARKRAKRIASELSLFPGETEIIQIDAEDPGSMDEKEVSLIRKLYLGD